MEILPTEKNEKQVCSINIMFAVDTDEKAIEFKKKIGEIFSTLPDVRIQFRLVTAPFIPPNQ